MLKQVRLLSTARRYYSSLKELHGFDPTAGVAASRTPPDTWYTEPEIFNKEKAQVFGNAKNLTDTNNWIPVGVRHQVVSHGNYTSGQFLDEPYVIVNDNDTVRSFYNVCQHHAAKLVNEDPLLCSGSDCKTIEKFVCPYHGWRYRLDGRLEAATKLKGIQNFKASKIRLQQIDLEQWGPLVFLKFFKNENKFPNMSVLEERIRPFLNGQDISQFENVYTFYKTVTYRVKCNWKVFIENYLDGGYHVKHLHHGLSDQLEEKSYKIECFDHYSIQSCDTASDAKDTGVDFKERIGDLGALYAYIYPNWMINIYQPMADINVIVPVSMDETDVVYHYYIRNEHLQNPEFVEKAILASHQVQLEDSAICESVAKGLKSSSYVNGYYSPELEHAAYHFHQMLYRDLTK